MQIDNPVLSPHKTGDEILRPVGIVVSDAPVKLVTKYGDIKMPKKNWGPVLSPKESFLLDRVRFRKAQQKKSLSFSEYVAALQGNLKVVLFPYKVL